LARPSAESRGAGERVKTDAGASMSKENGFLKLRREVLEHVRNGKMTHLEFNVFVYITSQADTRSGVWNGSANALAGEWALSPRAARRQLEALEAKGYLKRFPMRGSHLCYPVLVKRFLVTEGEHAGEFLNIAQSTGPMDLKYDKTRSCFP
jgi:hypothetical protein